MDLPTAIDTLNELVGRTVDVSRGVTYLDCQPFRVIRIDHFAAPELRCVVGCIYSDGSRYLKRRSVAAVSLGHKFQVAEAVILTASADLLHKALDSRECEIRIRN